jgi:hypothetical protein
MHQGFSLRLPFVTPSGNELLRMQRGSWRAAVGHKQEWCKMATLELRAALAEQLGVFGVWPAPRFRVRVVVTRYSSKMLDGDNHQIGCKWLRDILVREHLVRDDDNVWSVWDYQQRLSAVGKKWMTLDFSDAGPPICIRCSSPLAECSCQTKTAQRKRVAAAQLAMGGAR